MRILTAEAEHGCAGDIGMVDVSGEQAAERLRVLARAAAATLVGEEADAVDVGEDTIGVESVDSWQCIPLGR